jgi:hypothetical protein
MAAAAATEANTTEALRSCFDTFNPFPRLHAEIATGWSFVQ